MRQQKLPKSWGKLNQKFLQHLSDKPQKARKLKASLAVIAASSGLMSIIATWNHDNNWTERPKRYASFLGNFAQLVRELTSPSITVEVIT